MKYFVYIDESGHFNSKDKSIVGGFITTKLPSEIEESINKFILNFNRSNNLRFNVNDIHIAPLLQPEKAYKENEKNDFLKFQKIFELHLQTGLKVY